MTRAAVDIRRLDDVVASRIAAGEVVERPASVVKELVENSLDAGATDIRVEIEGGGRRLIRVRDDGHGIPADQAELALERHATSKIRRASDLEHVSTLGFRGEALAAIAAVSQLTLTTRARGAEVGVELRVESGRITGELPVGAPVGTTVTVENLFAATPARLRFLRQPSTEAGHVQDIVGRYALAHPDRRIRLVRDGRQVFQSPGTGALTEALVAVLGVDVAREMLPVASASADAASPDAASADAASPNTASPGAASADTASPNTASPDAASAHATSADAASADAASPNTASPGAASADSGKAIGVQGYASPTHVHRATRRHISLFVNGRWIQDRRITYAVIQAYHTLLPRGRFPIAVVRIEVPPDRVDVNVHPAKTEVRFRDGGAVFSAVQRAVRSAVVGGAPVPAVGAWEPRGSSLPRGARATFDQRMADAESRLAEPQATFLPGSDGDLPPLRVLGQVHQSYVVAEGPEGLYLIDQHAAHERVMYEEMLAQRGQAVGQHLLSPVAVTLPPVLAGAFEELHQGLVGLGFDIEPFGPDTVLVRAVPEVLVESDVTDAVRSVLELTAEGASPVEEAVEERLIRAVCKQATVKAGQTLSRSEMTTLVRRLEATSSPRTCPHGRPTVIVLSASRLEREFGRT